MWEGLRLGEVIAGYSFNISQIKTTPKGVIVQLNIYMNFRW